MAAATPLHVPEQAQEAILQFEKQAFGLLNQQWNIREQLRQRDLAYIRENDFTDENWKARTANRYGDPTKYRNVVVPIVMPQVESAVAYQAAVFLSGNPIFGWVAPPEQEDAALQFQAICEENSIRGGWARQFLLFFRDAFKYNLACISCDWDRINSFAVETEIGFQQGKVGKPKQVVWEGNCIERWDLYNSFWDTRVPPTEIYRRGEFAGTTKMMSRMELKKYLGELVDGMVMNYKKAFESGVGGTTTSGSAGITSYYIPQVNPSALLNVDTSKSTNWMAWAALALEGSAANIQYKNLYEVTKLYARILPSDFGLKVPAPNTPQIWKFIIVNHQVVVYAERQTNAHDNLPVFFCQPNEDGLWYQTKSLAENAEPFQAVGSALLNSAIAARRRAIGDRALYNPAYISDKHVNSDNPSAKIPVKPNAYGKPISEIYYSIPYKDDQSQMAFMELGQVSAMANSANGQNQARQGQFVKGNKTLHEYESVMQNASSRDQMTAMLIECQTMTPMKEVIKSNILQYQQAGEIYSLSQETTVPIDPITLRKSLIAYTLTDGLVPNDKVINGDDFTVALQTVGSSPQIGVGYNLAPMFSYLMKTRNLQLKPFEKSQQQIAYEQALGSWQQLAAAAIQKGTEFKQPQPKPADYGYQPGAPAGVTSQAPATNGVSNGNPASQ